MTTTQLASEVRECLAKMDVGTAHKFWATYFPDAPQPVNYAETRAMLHVARTAAKSSKLADRLYSHHWLSERQLPSKLPDDYKPWWEGTVIRSGVGIVVKATSHFQGRAEAIQKAMEDAVLEMYDAGIEDPAQVSKHMWFRASQVREW